VVESSWKSITHTTFGASSSIGGDDPPFADWHLDLTGASEATGNGRPSTPAAGLTGPQHFSVFRLLFCTVCGRSGVGARPGKTVSRARRFASDYTTYGAMTEDAAAPSPASVPFSDGDVMS
jgi:hypothetical protein